MSASRLSLTLLVVVLVVVPSVALAYYRNPVGIQPGFSHPTPLQSDDTLAGLPLSGDKIVRGSPTVAEVDGNVQNGKEIVIAGRDGMLYVYGARGARLWEQRVVSCAFSGDESLLNGAPSVADINGGAPEIIIGYGKVNADPNCPGGIRAFDSTGNPLWNYQIPINPISNQSSVFSTPSVADVDGRGDIVIAAGSADLYFHVLNKDGSLRWKYLAMDSIWSSPAFADVNNDGRQDIIFGTDFTPGSVCNPNNPLVPREETARGFLYAFPDRPTFVPDPVCARDGGTTIGFDKGYIWATRFDQSIYSSPAVGDIDGDRSLEVIVGASCFYGGDTGRWVKIFNAANGGLKQTLNAPNCVASSPAIGDVTGDGRLDIVAHVSSGGSVNPPAPTPPVGGLVVAWRYDSPNPIWQTVAASATNEQADLSEAFNSPVLADVDGNGSIEVISVVQNSITIFNGTNGQPLTPTCPPGGGLPGWTPECLNHKSMFMWMPIRSTPAVADIDNDQKLEIVVGGSHSSNANPAFQNRAFLYVWRDLGQAISSPPGPAQPYSAPWPQFQYDAAHTGRFAVRALIPSPSSLNVLLKRDTTRRYEIGLTSADGSNLSWSLSEVSDDDDVVIIAGGSGTTGAGARPTLTIDARGQAQGLYTATLRLSSSGLPDQTITVNVRVVNSLNSLYLPTITR